MGGSLFSKNDIEKIKDYLKENLSKKRCFHSMCVAKEAQKLAEIHGGDEEKCYLAGLVHDVAKEISTERQLELVNKSKLDVSEVERNAPPLYHAIAGAELLKELFGIDDDEIIGAVRYHTVGKRGMTRTEQIVYLADLVSEDRDYKDVKKMRKLARTDIEKAMYEALAFSICDSVGKGNAIPASTIEAYNSYAEIFKNRKD